LALTALKNGRCGSISVGLPRQSSVSVPAWAPKRTMRRFADEVMPRLA
jgi:hypothetical protein